MSDPQPRRLKPKPRRTEPLQPDKPMSGTRQLPASDDESAALAQSAGSAAAKKQKAQSETALENVKSGYD